MWFNDINAGVSAPTLIRAEEDGSKLNLLRLNFNRCGGYGASWYLSDGLGCNRFLLRCMGGAMVMVSKVEGQIKFDLLHKVQEELKICQSIAR